MNITHMMRQVQEMQSKMASMQERLADLNVLGQAGGGMVTCAMNGRGEVKKITLDPKLINPCDREMLEDLIVAACNDAKAKAEEAAASETEKIMGGLKLPPGMKLPF